MRRQKKTINNGHDFYKGGVVGVGGVGYLIDYGIIIRGR